MNTLADKPNTLFVSARALFYFLGCAVIALALTSYLTELNLSNIYAWLEKRFTTGFLFFLGLFSFSALFSIMRLNGSRADAFWQECSLQSANGVATLALTFTLLGISLGVGSLSQQTISPQTVSTVIQQLTQHFSMAFMTTVIGLPLATLLRAITQLRVKCLAVNHTKERNHDF